jgi:hypothetical protein
MFIKVKLHNWTNFIQQYTSSGRKLTHVFSLVIKTSEYLVITTSSFAYDIGYHSVI